MSYLFLDPPSTYDMASTESPSISVVIPTYNRKDKLKNALRSVSNQTLSPIEIIVVNDHPSSDLRELCSSFNNVRLINHHENRGASAARNTGIKAAEGEYIALLDDDDQWKPDKLKKQISKFAELPKDYGLVYTGTERYSSKGKKEKIPKHSGDVFYLLLERTFIPSETPLIKKECFENVGYFDTRFKSSQDLDMWLRISREYKISMISDILASGRKEHEKRIGKDMNRKYKGHKQLIEKYQNDFAQASKASGIRFNNLGYYALHTGHKNEARKYYAESIRQYLTMSSILHLILSYLPMPILLCVIKIKEEVL